MTVRKRGNEWWYDFGNHKYPGPIPEARTKYEAEQAEIKIKQDVLEAKYGKQFKTMLFAKFVGEPDAAAEQFGEGTFLDWARHNKRSWKHDQFRVRPLLRGFAGKTLGEITPGAIETFKSIRLHSITKRKTKRSPASVNMRLISWHVYSV